MPLTFQPAVQTQELAVFDQLDSELLCAIRYKSVVYVGRRIGGALRDELTWIFARLGPHKNASYEGFWAFNNPALRATAFKLSLDGARYEGDVALLDLNALDDEAAPVVLRWGIANGEELGGSVVWAVRLYNARTGALEYDQTIPATFGAWGNAAMTGVLGDVARGCYVAFVKPAGARIYRWPPPRFQELTGVDPLSVREWVHPNTGEKFRFHAETGLGALPFMLDDPGRLEYEARKEAGTLRKIPELVSYLVTFDESGNPDALNGAEWSALRIVIGEAAWLDGSGDVGAAPDANPGAALCRAENGALVPVALSPLLRSVGALKEIGGALFVGAMSAGRNGRMVALHEARIEAESVSDVPALGVTSVVERWCQCAESNETVNAIARFPDITGGIIHVTTNCELFARVPDGVGQYRLDGTPPGGNSLVTVKGPDGTSQMFWEAESDFASSSRFPQGFCYTIGHEASGPETGAGTWALYDSVLCEYGGELLGIVGFDPTRYEAGRATGDGTLMSEAQEYQALGKFNSGLWTPVAVWPKQLAQMGRVGRCGPDLWVFGVDGLTLKPLAMRLRGDRFEGPYPFPYYVLRADTTRSEDGQREVLLLTGRKHDASAPDNTALPGHYLVELTSEAPEVCWFWNADEGEFCIDRALFEQWFQLDDLCPFMVWQPEPNAPIGSAAGCWHGICERPETGVYLELRIGTDTICWVFKPDGAAPPYDFNVFPYICYDGEGSGGEGTDGGSGEGEACGCDGASCFRPDTGCSDADCVWPKLPQGTRIMVERYPRRDGVLRGRVAAFSFDSGATDDARRMAGLYPCFWIRNGATAPNGGNTPVPDTADLNSLAWKAFRAEFNQRAYPVRENWLNVPCESHFDLLSFVLPGFQLDTILTPEH